MICICKYKEVEHVHVQLMLFEHLKFFDKILRHFVATHCSPPTTPIRLFMVLTSPESSYYLKWRAIQLAAG